MHNLTADDLSPNKVSDSGGLVNFALLPFRADKMRLKKKGNITILRRCSI